MDVLASFRRQAHNNAWANYRLHRAVGALDTEAYRATRTSFFPSIHLTLVHILYVDLLYVDALEAGGRGRSLFPEMERAEREATFEQVTTAQTVVDRRLAALVEAMTDAAELDLPVHIERADHIQTETRGDVLLHLYEHQIHHRGQAHAMLAGTSVAPPQLDEFFLSEELPLRRAELEALGLPIR